LGKKNTPNPKHDTLKLMSPEDNFESHHSLNLISVIPKVRRTVAKVRQKLSWTDKIILIVGPIDQLTYRIVCQEVFYFWQVFKQLSNQNI
jgi:hypothetical protein